MDSRGGIIVVHRRVTLLIAFVIGVVTVPGVAGCAAFDMLPTGPVVDEETREVVWERARSSDVEYRRQAGVRAGEAGRHQSGGRTTPPALPFLVFGLHYDLDIVLASTHPAWEMHEIARIRTPDGPIWIAKDTRAGTGDQMLVTGLERPNHWLPEIPLARRQRPIDVQQRASELDELDLRIAYTNYDGEPVRIRYRGRRPQTRTMVRNGATMGHSRRQVMAVLDLPVRDFGRKASIQIGGHPYRIRRAAGLVPMRLALEQTQGGIPKADVTQRWDPGRADKFRTFHRMADGDEVKRTWRVTRTPDRVIVRQVSAMRMLEYRFLRGRHRGTLELLEARVIPWTAYRQYAGGADSPSEWSFDRGTDTRAAFRIRFRPALPDLRREFRGRSASRFVMDVGGERNHAVGEVVVRSRDDKSGAQVKLRGLAPDWVASRCVESIVKRGGARGESASTARRLTTDVSPCR